MKNLPSLGIGFEFAPAQPLATAHPTGISDQATSSRSVLASWVCLRQGSGKPGGASQGRRFEKFRSSPVLVFFSTSVGVLAANPHGKETRHPNQLSCTPIEC